MELAGVVAAMPEILDSLAEAVTIRDRSDTIVFANRAALGHMGFETLDELQSRPPRSIMGDYIVTAEDGSALTMDDVPSVRLLRGEAPEPLLMRTVNRATGAVQWNLLKATPLEGPGGEVEATATIIEDITVQKTAELHSRFVAQASAVLASSLSYEETLRNVAWLAVPDFADWCAVELIADDGTREQVVAAHRDPERLELAQRLREYDVSELDPEQGLGKVMRTGEPELYPEIPDELLVEGAVDEEHLRLLRELGMRSVLMVPIRTPAKTLGVMTLVNAESQRRFSEPDLQLAVQLGSRAAVAVENARLYGSQAHKAQTLQRTLLPDALPDIEDWSVAALYRPTGTELEAEVGGDFYDFFAVRDGWMAIIGDVTGKGIEAAAMTALVRHGARFISEYETQPAAFLRRLDGALREQPALSLASVLCLKIEGDTLTFSSGGHPLPLVIGPDGCEEAGRPGPLLGAFPDGEWVDHTVVAEPGQSLLLYTDGVTDIVGSAGRFGDDRLKGLLARLGPLAPEVLLQRLEAELEGFADGAQTDDMAALALQFASTPALEADSAARPPVGGSA